MNGPIAGLVLATALLLSACDDKPPLPVAQVDLARFQGQWFEIAKLPRATETGCEGTTATYRLKADGKLDLLSECRVDGVSRRMIAEAVATDPGTPGKLSLDIGGFYGDYWILEVGKDYEYAVVGHPTRDYLWILSRTPTIEKAELTDIVSRARTNQFDVSRLEYTVQTGEPAGGGSGFEGVEAREYGCAVARRGENGVARLLVAFGIVLAGLRRRYHTQRGE